MTNAGTIILKRVAVAFFVAVGLLFAQAVFAQGLDLGLQPVGENIGLSGQDIRVTIAKVIRAALGTVGILAFAMIAYGGVKWMTASGRIEETKEAQRILINAAIGLVIILAAFAITQFVISRLLEATGAGSGSYSSYSGGPGGGPAPSFGGSGFSLVRIVPSGSVPIRNVVVALTFSSAVSSASVQDNIVIVPVGSEIEVPGQFVTSGSVVRFTPNTPCPAPNSSRLCFDANTTYEARVASGLRGLNNNFVQCAFSGCQGQFTTGSLVDTEAPNGYISYPTNNGAVSASADIGVSVLVSDDAGVSVIEVSADNEVIGTDAPATNQTNYTGSVIWNTEGLLPNSLHAISATISDIAGNTADVSPVSVRVRPNHCFNGSLDSSFGETGIDCGGVPESEDFCGACTGSSCSTSENCASGFCVENICVALPEITSVQLNDGAPGNYITIGGRSFGTFGTATFIGDENDGGDDTVAGLACSGSWTDTQIVVAVPDSAASGPIRIKNAEGEYDQTNDTIGPVLQDFAVNDIVRPGLCAISPISGSIGSSVTLSGDNMVSGGSPTRVYFNSIPSASLSSVSASSATAVVPPQNIGESDVSVWVGDASSNPVGFTVVSRAAEEAAPEISYIEPAAGAPVGGYITIFGLRFGSQQGTVRFRNAPADLEAIGDTNFPDECEGAFWRSNSITVKVPEQYGDRTDIETILHDVRVVRADSEESASAAFNVLSGEPGPGVCAAIPSSGPEGTLVEFIGENFGSADGVVTFAQNVSAAVSSWSAGQVFASVPVGAESGAVSIKTADGSFANPVNFEVGSCDPNNANACGDGYQCCSSTLACVPASASCEITVPSTNYLFHFSTGLIPVVPEIVELCQSPDVANRIVSPTPWDGRLGGDAVCVNAVISGRFNVAMDVTSLNASTITAEKCVGSSETNPCAETTLLAGALSVGGNYFTVSPSVLLQPSSTYRVTINGARSAAGISMSGPYVWTFNTKTSAAPCVFEGVTVTPGTRRFSDLGNGIVETNDAGDELLSATGYGSDQCVLLNVGSDIAWSVASNASAGAVTLLPSTAPALKIVKAISETVENVAARVLATIVSQGINGASLITVNFTDPVAVNQWPSCSDACMGAEIGAAFNTAMLPSSFTTATVHLSSCANELCAGSLTPVLIMSPELRAGNKEVVIAPAAQLAVNTYYRVSLDDEIQSASGVHLTGLNYGQSYSWIFRTDAEGDSCIIDRVEMSPDAVTLYAVGERQAFETVPFGPPDACSAGGQRVSSAQYSWAWDSSNEQTAFLIENGTLDLPESAAAGCSSVCLPSGSNWYRAVCGNGIQETGEECDFGDTAAGDGCSAICLWEGKPACAAPTNLGCCGNAVVEAGEECDDNNTAAEDGCSAICLNEGSQAVGAVCGNGGAPAYAGNLGGEDCDDGNTQSGDGCSSQCLREGSFTGPVSVCGNNIVETGEECDDGDIVRGDGCSDRCLFEGARTLCSSPSASNCCGNFVTEPANFENCDGAEGCSARCLLEGSSVSYGELSICRDGILGVGESSQCDGPSVSLAAGDRNIDGAQIAEVSVEVSSQTRPASGLYSSNITAEEPSSNKEGVASLQVSCSCQASAECPTAGSEYGCGESTQCCFARLAAPSVAPVGINQCRNAEVRLTFAEKLDANSLSPATAGPQIALRLVSVDAPNCPSGYGAGTVPAPSLPAAPSGPAFLQKLLFIARTFVGQADALQADGCYLGATLGVENIGDHSEVVIRYARPLEPNATYQIEIYGDPNIADAVEQGVLNESGVGINAAGSPDGLAFTTTFTTGAEICDLDVLTVEDGSDTPGIFMTEDETHQFSAAAYSQVGSNRVAIQSMPGVYAWETRWATSDVDLVEVDDGLGAIEDIQSGSVSGTGSVTAAANITEPSSPVRVISASSQVRVFMCEMPWPNAISTPEFDAPFSDTAGNNDGILEGTGWTNFSILYCRAEKADDAAPLPAFLVTQVPSSPNANILKEFILRHPTLPEAVGIRVSPNLDYLPIDDWYSASGFAGSPASLAVDGFHAVRDGRTAYIGGVNVANSQFAPAVYIISYSEGAGNDTIDVFNQIVQNFVVLDGTSADDLISNARVCKDSDGFIILEDGEAVSCTADRACILDTGNSKAWCDANKDKIRRDLFRFEDMRKVESALAAYGTANRHCSITTNQACLNASQCPGDETCEPSVPLLDSGTYLRSWSTSLWPSWSAELGNVIGIALPSDPLNVFNGCPTGYDSASCFDAVNALYSCPASSHIYQYRRFGVSDYEIGADLESVDVVWAPDFEPITDNGTVNLGGFTPASATGGQEPYQCSGAIFGNSAVCGDGVIGVNGETPEVCEIGQQSVEPCTGGVRVTTCNSTCSGFTSDSNSDNIPDSACIAASCGNGVIEGACVVGTNAGGPCLNNAVCPESSCSFDLSLAGVEECDDGSNNGRYGYCSTSCDYLTAIICGNSVIEGPEQCDLGTQNGIYQSEAIASCAFDCSGLGPRCGDGTRNGGEACDSEFETWSGALCVNPTLGGGTFAPCSSDGDCVAANEVCGSVASVLPSLVCEQALFCSGGYRDGLSCTDSANNTDCQDPNSSNDGVCALYNTYRSRTCGTPLDSCEWSGWSACMRQGSCGDNVIDPGEECDDGNASNADSCTNSCTDNVCGDGFLNPSVESCDLGASNGVQCQSPYGGTCNFCTAACSYQTISGGFCGDNIVNGNEVCDGTPVKHLWTTATREVGNVCDTNSPACSVIGACNGGDDNGLACTVDAECAGTAAGRCVLSVCDPTCGNTCPFNYQSVFALARPYFENQPLPGSTFQDSVTLKSYLTNGECAGDATANDDVGNFCDDNNDCESGTCLFEESPNEARVQIPACRVGSQLLADIDYNINYPDLDVVFVVDYSASMNNHITGNSGPTRFEVMKESFADAVGDLYDDYPGEVRTGLVLFGANPIDGPTTATTVGVAGYDPLWASSGSGNTCRRTPSTGEAYFNAPSSYNAAHDTYDWPEDPLSIVPNAAGNPHSSVAACIKYLPYSGETAEVDLTTYIENLSPPNNGATTGNMTPTEAGLNRARIILDQFPDNHSKVVVLLSDGAPYCRGLGQNNIGCREVADGLFGIASEMKADGIEIYTATYFGGTASYNQLRANKTFHLISSDCPVPAMYLSSTTVAACNIGSQFTSLVQQCADATYENAAFPYDSSEGVYWYGRFAACTDTPSYSYVGNTASAFGDMFQSIITNIVNARLSVGSGNDANTAVIRQGPGVVVPLPQNFACNQTAETPAQIRVTFGGTGTVGLSNFRFFHCPITTP